MSDPRVAHNPRLRLPLPARAGVPGVVSSPWPTACSPREPDGNAGPYTSSVGGRGDVSARRIRPELFAQQVPGQSLFIWVLAIKRLIREVEHAGWAIGEIRNSVCDTTRNE
jgi:hypothetical protein